MKNNSDRSLESLKLFPFFAWAVFIMFAVFVYTLTNQLDGVTSTLEETTATNATITESLTPYANANTN